MPRPGLPRVALPPGRVRGKCPTQRDHMTNVQKRLGNRVWVGGGQCWCCGSFLDPLLEHAESCSNAEATRRHYACVHAVVCGMKLADPGITTEPRCSLLRNPGRPTLSPPLQSPDAVRLWTCVWPDIAYSQDGQQMSAKSLHRRWKHEILIALLRRRAAMVRAVLPNPSARSGSSQGSLTELCATGDMSLLSTAGLATTTSTTLRLTQQYQTTMTLSPLRAT